MYRPLPLQGLCCPLDTAPLGTAGVQMMPGWWIEGCIEDRTGWSIGLLPRPDEAQDRARVAASLYEKLEHKILPQYYKDRGRFVNVMLHAIALNGSFFNTQRMMQEYALKAYYG